jgi:hypothetical protein
MTNKGILCSGGCGRKKTQMNRHYAPGCGATGCVPFDRAESDLLKALNAQKRRGQRRRQSWWDRNKPVPVEVAA